MTTTSANLPPLLHMIARYRHVLVPIAFLMLIAVLVVPLPPIMLDLLITANFSLSAIVLLTTILMTRALDFTVFPSLLLVVTLFRLVLNVASTRLILSADAPSAQAAGDVAGHVISAFGGFVAGESLIVGAIIFLILVIVQFIVVTKGATRMSEVGARFTLDAMPGRQMAIDADLAAGVIDDDTARSRRAELSRESDFFGAMDGASKFVRGDAVAAIIITVINIVGGFAIGTFEKGWSLADSLSTFTRLTIGDGLVSQIPSFIVAVAAGLIVARAGESERLVDQLPRQLGSQPLAFGLIAGFLTLLALTPLPSVPLLLGAAVFGSIAMMRSGNDEDEMETPAETPERPEPSLHDLLALDALEVEIGCGLVGLVDPESGGDILARIGALRRQIAVDLGIVVPPIRIRDDLDLDASTYRVRLRGSTVAHGRLHAGKLMAVRPGSRPAIDGIRTTDPAFGLDAVWIDPTRRAEAEAEGCTVVDACGVLSTHLAELTRDHAADLLSREEVARLLDELRERAPRLVDEVIPALVRPGELQQVLRNLLREGVPVRDLETIVEALGDVSSATRDIDAMTDAARRRLRRVICDRYARTGRDGQRHLHCLTVDPRLEERIDEGGSAGVSAAEAGSIAAAVSRAAEPLVNAGHPLVVVTSSGARRPLKRILDARLDDAVVLSYPELVPHLDVQSRGLVQLPLDSGRTGPPVGAAS